MNKTVIHGLLSEMFEGELLQERRVIMNERVKREYTNAPANTKSEQIYVLD